MRMFRVLTSIVLMSLFPSGSLRGDEAEDKAAEVVKLLGGEIMRDPVWTAKQVISVTLNGQMVTDDTLKELAGLKYLKMLSLNDTKVTDAGLKELGRFKALQYLSLFGNAGVTEASFQEWQDSTPLNH